MMIRLFVVDDEPSIREGIALAFEDDFEIQTFERAREALAAMKKNPPDIMLLDIGLPGMSGIEALSEFKQTSPETVIIMVTALEDVDTVVAAMKGGAFDYIVKPIHIDTLRVTLDKGLDTIRLTREVKQLQERYLQENLPCFIGESHAIQDIMEFIGQVAKSPDTPILIQGETGTGKELIAAAVHYRSPNFQGRLVSVNCASIPRELIESELFGYEKGAFTGASDQGKKGLIEEASGGTLFLDEIGDLSLEAQAKLLRFLEEKEFYRVGGTDTIHIETRLVSATNKDLEQMVRDKLFRKDLFFRLSVIRIDLPSLNERGDDIIPLAMYFLHEYARKFDKKFKSITPEARETLKAHAWTGNVRELRNIIERAVLVGRGPALQASDLGLDTGISKAIPSGQIPPEGLDLEAVLTEQERQFFETALKLSKGNEKKAARLLNLNYHTFRYRRRKLFTPL